MFHCGCLFALFLALLMRIQCEPVQHDRLAPLLECKRPPNPHTQHLRIPNLVHNISQTPGVHHFNPTIIALPPWAQNQYLLVSRVVTEGLHQESILCEAKICSDDGSESDSRGGDTADEDCTAASRPGEETTTVVLPGSLYCATPPTVIDIPPTPAEQCDGPWSAFPDIPGFHDPRIFWSGSGEPLIIVNSASQYACLGLWIGDLRTLYAPLKKLLASRPGFFHHASGPPISYSQLTELTRNPASTRSAVEKNWFLFFPSPSTSYIHYDLSPPIPRIKPTSQNIYPSRVLGVRQAAPIQDLPPTDSPRSTRTSSGRTFSKLLANGHTTPNLTSPLEQSCLTNEPDPLGQPGNWHQATNALKLILCHRRDAGSGTCDPAQDGRSVHFAIIHRKFSNIWDLPLRYERYFVVWDAKPPFQMCAISKYPVLFRNETASGWTGTENWEQEMEEEEEDLHTRLKDESKTRSKMLTMRASMDRFDAILTNETFYPTSNTTNSTEIEHDDAWFQKKPVSGRKWENWAYFTYTPSIAWAWRPQSALADGEDELESPNVGYLDDEVILGIGMDDTEQAFARAKAETLLQCLRPCPGINSDGALDTENVILGFEREDESMRMDTENRDLLDVYR